MMTTKNVCVFGDSIAYGEWSRDGGWVDRLRAALQRRTLDYRACPEVPYSAAIAALRLRHPTAHLRRIHRYGSGSAGTPRSQCGDFATKEDLGTCSSFQEYYFLYNESIPGNTTEDVISRFSAECEAREPHIIVFAVGINDASSRGQRDIPRVALPRFEENIRTLFGVPTRRDAETIAVIGLTRVDEKLTAPFEDTYFFNERIAAYDAALKKICEQSDTPYLDVSQILQSDDLQDGLHPNDAGHEKLFCAVSDFLAPFLVER